MKYKQLQCRFFYGQDSIYNVVKELQEQTKLTAICIYLGNNFNLNDLQPLTNILINYQSIQKLTLYLQNTSITNKDIDQLAFCIGRMKQLTSLTLALSSIIQSKIKNIDSLAQEISNLKLQILDLSISGSWESRILITNIDPLALAIFNMVQLKELTLVFSYMNISTYSQLYQAIKHISSYNNLQKFILDLSDTYIEKYSIKKYFNKVFQFLNAVEQ